MGIKKILRIQIVVFSTLLFTFHNGLAKKKEKVEDPKVESREQFYKDFIQKTDLNTGIIAAYDSLISISFQQNKTKEICLWQIEKANTLNKMGQYSASYFESKKTIHLIDSLILEKDRFFFLKRNDCLYNMAKMTLNLGFYDQSVNYLLDMLSENKEVNQNIRAYSLLGMLFIHMDKLQIGENYIEKANDLIQSSTQKIDSLTLFNFHNNRGGVFYAKEMYSEAIEEMKKAEIYARDEYGTLAIYINLSNIYFSLGEKSLALNYLLNILKNSKEKTNYVYALAAQNAGYIYFTNEQYAEALEYYQKALQVAQQIDAKKLVGHMLIEMSDVYKELGDYKTAWEYQKTGHRTKDSVMSTKAMEEIIIKTNNFEQRQEKLEKQILTQKLLVNNLENKNKTILLFVLIFMLIIFTALLFIILRRLIAQQKNNKSLNQTISSIENNTEQKVLHTTQKLNEDLDSKNRKLTSNSLLLFKASEIMENLKNHLKKLKEAKTEEDSKQLIAEMESILSSHNTDQSWQEFKLYFEQVHPNFFIALNSICSDLSQNEQRICALIFLNFSTKEIASITNRSPRTIETTTYQIRKKLNIPSEEKTANYLQHILQKE